MVKMEMMIKILSGTVLRKTVSRLLSSLRLEQPYDTAISLLGIYTIKIMHSKGFYIALFTAAIVQ